MASRLHLVLTGVVLLASAGPIIGCRKDKAPEAAPEQAASAAPTDPAAIRVSIGELEPSIKALEGKFSGLRQQFNPLPPSLPGFDDVRAKFYGTDEVVGRMGVKLEWLSGRLDAAVQAGKTEDIAEIAKQVNETHDEIKALDRIALELIHEIAPFQRMMREVEAARAQVLAEKAAASASQSESSSSSPPAPKTTQSAAPKASAAPKPSAAAKSGTAAPSAPQK